MCVYMCIYNFFFLTMSKVVWIFFLEALPLECAVKRVRKERRKVRWLREQRIHASSSTVNSLRKVELSTFH